MTDFDAKAREIVEDRVSEWWAIPLTAEQRPHKLIHAKLQEMFAAALKAAYNEGLEDAAVLADAYARRAFSGPHGSDIAGMAAHNVAKAVRAKKVPT
jgi:hypothetical protein